MMATNPEFRQPPADRLDMSSSEASDHVDRMLDEAIEDTFPNSDPVSLAMPHERIEATMARPPQPAAGIRDAWPLLVIGGIIAALLLGGRR